MFNLHRGPIRSALMIPCAFALLVSGCGEPVKEAAMTTDSTPVSGGTARLLMDADRRFAADVAAARGDERARTWAWWFAPSGRQLVPAAVVTGPSDILALMAPAFADPGFSLTWAPDLADGAGAWGWTSGRYVSTRPGADGPVSREGRYLTVWQRQPDGAWKVAVDTGVPDGG